MQKGEYKQFKLVTGEEIVCEVLEWPDEEDDHDNELVIRRALKILAYEPTVGGPRVYLFRPWMVLQADGDQFQTLADFQIVAEANPSERMLEQYLIASKAEASDADSDEDIVDIARRLITEAANDSPDSDGLGPKVIKFPAGRTIH